MEAWINQSLSGFCCICTYNEQNVDLCLIYQVCMIRLELLVSRINTPYWYGKF